MSIFKNLSQYRKAEKIVFPGGQSAGRGTAGVVFFSAIPAVPVLLMCALGKELPLPRLRSSRGRGSGLRRPEKSRTRPRNETLTNHSSDVIRVAVRAAYLANERAAKLVAVKGAWTYDLMILSVRVSVEGQGTNDPRCVCMISGQ